MKRSETISVSSKSTELELEQASARVSERLFGIWVLAVLVCFVLCGLVFGSESLISEAVGLSNEGSLWMGIAGFLILTGCCLARMRGDSLAYCIFVGLVISILASVEVLKDYGSFKALQSFSLWITSIVASQIGQTNVLVDDTILFRHFNADEFFCVGRWNSVLCYLGVGVFCVLSFGRRLVPAGLTLVASVMVWPVVICALYIAISFLAPESEMPSRSTWSFYIELVASLLGVVVIIGVDCFVAAFFRPIPSKLLRSEDPFLSYVWNWLCELPDPIYRATNPSLSQQRSSLRRTKRNSSMLADLRWLRRELVLLVVRPFRAICSLMDAARAWRNSRRWKGMMFSAPAASTLVMAYLALPFCLSSREDLLVLELEKESLGVCSTQVLESISLGIQEKDFTNAIGGSISEVLVPSASISDNTKKYIELLSRRVLSLEPKNQIARYRLGLILHLNEDVENAKREMQLAASRELNDFPQADEWLAKNLVIEKASGQSITEGDLQLHLANASRMPDCDFRLLFLYSSLLESKGASEKAVAIAKLGVEARPESILDLARLYTRLGDEEGRVSAATKAVNYFETRLSLDDNELTRLAIADAKLLCDQLADACEILEEGVRKKVGGDKSRRQLSEIQRVMYLGSIRKNEKADVEVDLSLLEKASDSDPSNPNISNEVAKLLAIKTRPTKKLLEALQSHIDSGIATATCHLILGEKYFAMGKLKLAEEHWESAIRKEPNNVTALNNLAMCLTAISPSNVDRSIALVAKADLLAPNNADILDTWGDLSMVADRPRDAVNKFELAIKNDAKRIDIRKKLVLVYRAAGLDDMAETQLKLVQSLESVVFTKKN